jgi:S-methylmethionine-dependent homocysteine/selenocysteine methylase
MCAPGTGATVAHDDRRIVLARSPLFGTDSLWLTDGGIETVLMFRDGIDLPCFATFPLLEHAAGRTAVRAYLEPFLELAHRSAAGFVLSATTWRANPDWGGQLGYDHDRLAAANRRSIEFMAELRADSARPGQRVLVEGLIGPRGDAYAPASAMSALEAERYHAPQLQTLSDTALDLATAMTITYPEEAIGIVRAAVAVGVPIAMSFTVETDGRLPSGQTLRAAIEQVDAETDGAAEHFMINCAHPAHFESALSDDGAWRGRIRGLRANASMLSHAALDESDDLDDGDPLDLAARYAALRGVLPNLGILGGCCGTDIRHVSAICEAWQR